MTLKQLIHETVKKTAAARRLPLATNDNLLNRTAERVHAAVQVACPGARVVGGEIILGKHDADHSPAPQWLKASNGRLKAVA